MKKSVFILIALLFAGCTRHAQGPVGIREWASVSEAADRMALDAEPSLFLRSVDRSNVPESKWDDLTSYMQKWKGARLRNHHIETKIFTALEYEAYLGDKRKEAPPESLIHMPERWNVVPDRVLLYRFERKNGNNESAISLKVGAFSQNGLWYFSSTY